MQARPPGRPHPRRLGGRRGAPDRPGGQLHALLVPRAAAGVCAAGARVDHQAAGARRAGRPAGSPPGFPQCAASCSAVLRVTQPLCLLCSTGLLRCLPPALCLPPPPPRPLPRRSWASTRACAPATTAAWQGSRQRRQPPRRARQQRAPARARRRRLARLASCAAGSEGAAAQQECAAFTALSEGDPSTPHSITTH